MNRFYLSIDIGASSGRHIVSWRENGRIRMKEVYRFDNRLRKEKGHLCWDLDYLFEEILKGMRETAQSGMVPVSVAIDTWGVDYVLLDEAGEIIGDTYAYRDDRTKGVSDYVYERISEEKLYERTGIQKAMFNTVYQLAADRLQRPEVLDKAKTFLMLPDYFVYRLTGVRASEYTNATTTQLVNAKTGQWDYELMELLDIPKDIFLSLNMPGTVVGKISAEMISKTGFTCNVIQCATHDTASAVMAVPSESNDSLYISSGTWSLMGVENNRVQNSEKARLSNFTNEGGYDHRYRFLKNIMGLWMIQSVRHEEGDRIPFVDYAEMARENDDFGSLVDVNDLRFLAPESMIDEIKAACAEGGQRVPETSGELAAVIYNSLADSYAKTVAEIEEITGKKYDAIHIVGGGCKNRYLNQITASASGLPVYAGPAEATAIGNALSQMIALGDFKDLGEARACVYESFEIDTYRP